MWNLHGSKIIIGIHDFRCIKRRSLLLRVNCFDYDGVVPKGDFFHALFAFSVCRFCQSAHVFVS